MTVPATFQELIDTVADYGHRSDLTDQIGDTFIPFASLRLGQSLKSIENEVVVTLQPTANPFELPDDYGSIRSLEFLQAGGPRTLRSTGRHDINRFSTTTGTGGFPRVYNVLGGKIDARPFLAGDYDLNYYSVPKLDAINTTNDVLDAFPNLYLYASLIEFHTWTQDREQRETVLKTFVDEVGLINRNAERGRYDAPAQIGV